MIYLASPYTNPSQSVEERRYMDVRNVVSLLVMKKQVPVFSPIVYFHRMAGELNLPTDAKAYLAFNTAFQRMASHLFVLALDGWDTSAGVEWEYKFAKTIGQPMMFIDEFGNNTLPVEQPEWL